MPPKKRANVEKAQSPCPAASAAVTTSPAHNSAAAITPSPPQSQAQPHASCSTLTKTEASSASPTLDSGVNNVRTFCATGRFVTAPRTYMELLRAYVEFVVYGAPADAAPNNSAVPAALNQNGVAAAASAPRPSPVPDPAMQVRTLLFVAVPHRVTSYFDGVPLTATDVSEAGKAAKKMSSIVASQKRDRSHSKHAHTRSGEVVGDEVEENTTSPQPSHHPNSCTTGMVLSPEVMLQRLTAYGGDHLAGFDSDSAYLAATDVLVYMRHYAFLFAGMGLSASVLKSIEVAGLDFRQQCVPCVEAVVKLVQAFTEVQLRKMPLAPRVVRLSRRLQLSSKAAQTLEYLLVCHCGRYTPGVIAEPLRPANIAYHNDLTPQELLSILSESGVLWKQGLAFSDIKLRASFMECKYALPLETIAALSGDQLSEEQLIKLERTALSEVLNEERHMKPESPVAPVGTVTAATAAATTAESAARARGAEHDRSLQTGIENDDGGVCGSPSRRASRSPLVHRRRRDGAGDNDHEDEGTDYDETLSTAESTLTITEDELDDALGHIDPKVLASGDEEAIHDAVAQHLAGVAAKAVRQQTNTTATATTTTATADSVAAEKVETAPPADTSKPDEVVDKTGDAAEVPAPVGAKAGPSIPGPATDLPAAHKPQLTLAEINPLAQRYRHGTASLTPSSPSSVVSPQSESSMRDTPYDSDIEYMDAAFRILANIIRIRYAEGDMKDEEDTFTPKNKVEASLRELKGKVRVAAAVHESRLRATLAANTFTPRIEQLARRLKLTEMEKQIMLFMVGNVISHDMLVAVNGRYVMRDGQRLITVGYMLFVLCETLEERVVARGAFYQSAPLIANGVLSLSFETTGRSCFNTDLMDYLVDIDRKIVDDVMGIVAETAEMVPGSQLYFPSVELANVVLPTSTMERILSTIEHYSLFEQCKRKSGFGEGLGTSKGGLVMLFYGPSGTGKTMLANAVAHHLQKKILLVSVSQFRTSTKAENDALKFLFREAKLSDAIIFFDECESLFEDRQSNTTVTALLSEFERYDGLVILATNKAQNFDEAMNRRISLMMEFRPPDHQLRLRIWKSHIPKQLTLADDVALEKLALNYELSGGLIRNAVLAALSQAVAREKNASPTLTMADLDEGARLQLRGFFLAAERPEGMSEFYVTPKRTLAELVVEASLAKKLEAIASVAKSRSTLYTQWGFSEDANDDCGALYLFQGVSGTGKSLAAEGIAYECGATIRLCNVAELLLREEMRVHAVFEEGRRLGAIIVFDEAQVLFNESPKSLQLSQLIQYHARRYARPVIVIATTTSRDGGGGRQLFSTTAINSRSSCMLFQAEVTFVLPSRQLREQLWKRAFPERVPIAADVDYAKLSSASISPKLIRTVAFSVCCEAALMPVAERTVTMAMIEKEVERALVRERSSVSASAMFA